MIYLLKFTFFRLSRKIAFIEEMKSQGNACFFILGVFYMCE